MKRSTTLTAVLTLFAVTASTAQPAEPVADLPAFTIPETRIATTTHSEWQAFAGRLSDALESENDGVRAASMRAMIQYGDYLQIDRETVIELGKVYRNDKETAVRRMAVVALAATDDAWAIDFLVRSLRFEQDPAVQYTVASVLIERGKIGLGPALTSN